MNYSCIAQSLSEVIESWDGDTLAVGLFAPDSAGGEQPLREELHRCFGEALFQQLERRGFKGKAGDCLVFSRLEGSPDALIVVGLGEPGAYNLSALRAGAAAAATAAAKLRCRHLGLALPCQGLDGAEATSAMAEAVRLSLYRDQRFRSEPDDQPAPQCLSLIDVPAGAEAGLGGVAGRSAGVELARQLVAAPPNVATPAHLADMAAAIAEEFQLELKVLERSDCEALGMGAYLGVAQGSDLPPKFIHLTYHPPGPVERRVALVGKGLTFDSGGYNLKTAGSQIEMMKYDMGGSAAVLGAARAIGELKPAGVEVHVIVAACENMINGSAVHPGDILTASNGKTIEINNTDAEGRLTLADALVYACKLEPDAVVDLATLTGACVIALGEEMAGLWSSSDGLATALDQASQSSGEGLWRMPLRPSYKTGLKSPVADMKNTGPRPGGSITAALFLQDFVSEGVAWAHLDIAGTVWSDKGRGENPAGATGYGVRTLVNWVMAGAPVEPADGTAA